MSAPKDPIKYQEWKNKISSSLKGKQPKNKVGGWNKGKHLSNETKQKLRLANLGKKYSLETIEKRAVKMRGKLNPNYKNGMSKFTVSHYADLRYKLWREAIFERDDYTCQQCKLKGVYIEANHIKSWAHFPELRFELSNGLTLCRECHKLTDNYKGKNNGKGKQLI